MITTEGAVALALYIFWDYTLNPNKREGGGTVSQEFYD